MQDIDLPEHKQRIIQQAQQLTAASLRELSIDDALEIVAETWLLMGPQLDSLPNAPHELPATKTL